MKVIGIYVGGVKGALTDPVRFYEERSAHYFRTEWIEVTAGAGSRDDAEAVRQAEGERILNRIPDGAEVIALTRDGKGLSSRSLSNLLAEAALHGRDVAFIIGGAFGLSAEVLQRAGRRLALSPMTLPHEMARLLLTEQIYRAGTIARNEPYHKGP